jgi:adenylate cyclase class 2
MSRAAQRPPGFFFVRPWPVAYGLWPEIIASVIEREIKLAFASVDEARAALRGAGAEMKTPRRLQDDVLYDTARGTLRGQRSALRLRRDGDRAIVTFKGPAANGPMKMREEIESGVESGDALAALLHALGFAPCFRYQKYREEYRADGVVAAIDDTPAGVFVEIEGDERGILALASAIGRAPKDFILDSYYAVWIKAKGERAGDMIF